MGGDTYRHGGVSEKPYDSLNLAFHVGGDDPESVRRNRSVITDYLGVDAGRITCGNQVHGLKVVEITEQHIGAGALTARRLSMIAMPYLQRFRMCRYYYLPPIVWGSAFMMRHTMHWL